MNPIFTFIQTHKSCCLNCGAFSVEVGLLCVYCSRKLERLEHKNTVTIPPLQLRTYYRWYPGQSDLLSSLILGLKGKGSKLAWSHYAEKFIRRYFHEVSWDEKLVIVPAPSTQFGKKDHAYLWAKGLCNASGATFIPLLKKSSTRHQRGSSRGERALLEMEIVENYSNAVDFSSKTRWIFADDILTTGATARAAHKALGSPRNFEIWTLAYRSLSCGAAKDLL